MKKYIDRQEAGIALGELLKEYANKPDTIALALPRGGVPIAHEVAKMLAIPMDIFIVRKLGVPEHEELAMGAVASGGTVIYNQRLIKQMHINSAAIHRVLQQEQQELLRREQVYRGDRPFPKLSGKTVILIDDGIATGASMEAAIKGVLKHNPKSVTVAVPVGPLSTCVEIAALVDSFVCPLQPVDFYAVGLWYERFPQTTDEEVIACLRGAQ